MRRKLQQNSGMTLLELLFASGITATALSMIFGALIGISVMGELNESQALAASTVAGVMEEIRTLSFEELKNYTPPNLHGPGISYLIQVDAMLPGEGSDTETEAAEGTTTSEIKALPLPLPSEFDEELPNPLELRVTLTWQEDSGHAFKMTAATLRRR